MRIEAIVWVTVVSSLCGCGDAITASGLGDASAASDASDASAGADATANVDDVGASTDADSGVGARGDASSSDLGTISADATTSADAGGPIDLDGGTTIVVIQPISGAPTPTATPLHGPGLILMGGGTDVDAAFVWMHDTLAGSPTTRLGNVVVLRADDSTDNAYTSYIYALAPFQSVTTIYLGGSPANGTPATPADLALAAAFVDRADAVFFAGGDQADYVSWKGSPLIASISALYARGGVVGGTSAGCAIQGPFVFDSVSADAAGGANVETADSVANPFESTISFTRGMFAWPTLPRVVTDMHFVTRDRLGRLATFVARQYADGAASSGVVGVGVDESNALLIDKTGHATLVQQPSGTEASAGSGAYVLQPSGPATTCAAGRPLSYEGVTVTRLTNPATDSFDFGKGCGAGTALTITVDGSNASSPYSVSPYTTAGKSTKCP